MVGQKVTLAAACMLVEHDTSGNMKKIVEFIKEAAEKEAGLLVFPECAVQGYLWTWNWKKWIFEEDEDQRRYFYDVAEPIPGPSTEIIAKYAACHKMFIQIGMAERVEMEKEKLLYNSVAIIGPEGLIGVFRKISSSPWERVVFQGGKDLPVFDTSVGKIGPIICADIIHPESARVLALKGADIITFSTAWGMNPRPDTISDHYDLLTRTNAIVNGVWMVVSDQVGAPKRSKQKCYGHSRIIDPKGNIIAGIGYEEGLVTAKVDVKTVMKPRLLDRFWGRCPEAYKTLTS